MKLKAIFVALFMFFVAPAAYAQGQQVGVPAYFVPGPLWTQLESGAPIASIAIMNPNSGPGTSISPAYAAQVADAKAHGVAVYGYVSTAHLSRSWTAITTDVDRYFSWYNVDGIFFDEADHDCITASGYADLADYVRTSSPSAQVALNPGLATSECYMDVADIVVTFEGKYTAYKKYAPHGWELRYPASRFWHLVYATTATDKSAAIALSRTLNAGTIYVTSDTGANPWDTLPAYWADEVTEAAAPFTPPAFPMSNWAMSNNATQALYSADFTGTWTYKRIYIDRDRNLATGFPFESTGADMLIENGWLYAYSGVGGSWTWTAITTVTITNSAGHVSWTVPLSALGVTTLDGSDGAGIQIQLQKGTAAAISPIEEQIFQ